MNDLQNHYFEVTIYYIQNTDNNNIMVSIYLFTYFVCLSVSPNLINIFLGLGFLLGERLFFHENDQNYQERCHCSEKKNEHINTFLTFFKRSIK